MTGVFVFLVPLALAAVFATLVFGVVNLARGGSAERSQMLMRWRVGLQLVALVFMMVALYLGTR